MKRKNYLIILSLMTLGIAACGEAGSYADLQKDIGNETKIESQEKEQQESSIITNLNKETESEKETETKEEKETEEPQENTDSNTAVYQYKDIYMSIELPAKWEYEIQTVKKMKKQDGLVLCAIDFWLKENPDLKLQLSYWRPHSFGMCGTDVTIEEITFDNGLSACKYTETSDDIVWFTLAYESDLKEGTFVVSGDIKQDIWSEYETELMELLGMVQLEKLKNIS